MSEFNFDPAVTAYNGHNALALGRAALLSYDDATKIEATLRTWGFPKRRFLDTKGTQAFVASSEEMILVAFRGTEITRLEDLKTDAKVALVPAVRGRAHHGFVQALSDVWESLVGTLSEFRDRGQPVWVTGHSLGAALATLATAQLEFGWNGKRAIPVRALYAFASPRVGDTVFAGGYDAVLKTRTFRYRNNNDVVTRVPVAGLFLLRYRHVGNLLYFDEAGRLAKNSGMVEQLRDRLRGRLDDLGNPGSDDLKDHAMKRYLEHLEANVDIPIAG